VAWLLWAQFAACLVIEVAAEIRLATGRSADWLSRAPGTWRGQQAFARTLVQAVVALGVASSAAATVPAWAPHAAAATTPAPGHARHTPEGSGRIRHAAPPAGAPTQAPTETVTVHRGDTLWSIAEAHLGAGERWRDIATLNNGRIMADGERFLNADRIRPGWTLLLPTLPAGSTGPASARTSRADTVTVEQGDTLWSIAEHQYSAGADWPTIYYANAARIEDPNLIHPGQRLAVPTPSNRATPRPPQQSTRPDRQRHSDDPHPAPRGMTRPAGGHPPPTASQGAAPRTGSPPQPSRDDAPAATHASEGSSSFSTLARALAGGGMLLAGCLAGAYAARRRAQFRVRRSGRTIPRTRPESAPVERDIRNAAQPGSEAVAFLDRALRDLGAKASVLPDVVAARLSSESLELILQSPTDTAPAGWVVTDQGSRWRLPRTYPLSEATGPAPYPTLVSIGVDSDDATWLLDLEAAGRVQLHGPAEVCDDVIQFLTAELATNRWSDVVHVKVAGIEPELLHLNPARLTPLRPTDLNEAQEKARRVTAAQAKAGLDVLSGRQHLDSGDVWSPLLMLATTTSRLDEGEGSSLMEDHGGRRCATAVVLAGAAASDGVNIPVEKDGYADVPWAGRLQLNRLSAEEARAIGSAFANAEMLDDEPMPSSPLAGSGPVAGFADEAGAISLGHTHPRPAESRTPASLLPEPNSVYVQAAATTEQDLQILAPQVSESAQDAIRTADPHLDDDLGEWTRGEMVRPQLRLLGPIELRVDQPIPDVARGRIAYLTEVAAYLFCHPAGVTTTQLADVFRVQPSTIHKRIQELREWLGVDPSTGAARLPEAKLSETGTARGVGNYELTGVLGDLDLFRRLRVRGQSRGAEGLRDLIAALDLVTGPPFDQQRPHGYGWLASDATDHHLTAGIVDVAHIVATSALASGNGERAAWAASKATQVAPYEDKPRLDYAAALDAMGHHGEARGYLEREILDRSDDDLAPPDPTPRVEQVLASSAMGRRDPSQPPRSDRG
jgi:nucleoid-associated protein YgaU